MLDEKSIEIYSSRDKIREQIIELTKSYLKLQNLDFSKTSYLSYLVNILSVLDANLLYYVSSVYKELFLTKAVTRESVLNWSALVGYKPQFAKPATCSILIGIPYKADTITEEPDTVITLYGRNHIKDNETDPDYNAFKIYSQDKIPFTLINTVTYELNNSSADGLITIKQQINSTNENGNIEINYKNIDYRLSNNQVQFFVDFIQIEDVIETFNIPYLLPNEFYNMEMSLTNSGSISDIQVLEMVANTNSVLEEWMWKDSLFNMSPKESAYTHKEKNNGIIISFGNGIIGKQPKQGTEMFVKVGITQGDSGNVIAGSIRSSDPVRAIITDTVNGEEVNIIKSVNLFVINREPSQYGEDAPSTDEIRANAIKKVSTNDRLVSQYDYLNADTVIDELPINNVFQVLKRSDLKRNEITLFTDLIYENSVVPTRNTYLTISDYTSDSTSYQIPVNTTVLEDGDYYYTMFDIFLNKYTRETKYFYYIKESNNIVNIIRSASPTRIFPIYAYFNSDRENDILEVEFHCNKFDTTGNFTCTMEMSWPMLNGVRSYELNEKELSESEEESIIIFTTDFGDSIADYTIELDDIPEGRNIEFTFTITDTTSNEVLNVSTTSVILKKELTDFMYSQLVPDTEATDVYYVYDVPVIQKDFYDNLEEPSKFTQNVMNKIINFNVLDYKMLTDSVNLKFANTVGNSTNMKYNDINRNSVLDINISSIPTSPSDGDRYAISDVQNPWYLAKENGEYVYSTARIYKNGFIVEWDEDLNDWTFELIKINDFFEVTNLNGEDTSGLKMIYTGEEIREPTFEIPLELNITVFPSTVSTVTPQILSKTIKDKLIDELSGNFGYNRPLYISEITKIVQSVKGVQNCRVNKPTHDVYFVDDMSNLTIEELLLYTPELIYFDVSNITIDIRL